MNKKLKLKILLITLFTINCLFSQNSDKTEDTIRIGKQIKDTPILWVVIYESDTLEIYTKDYEKIYKNIKVDNLESMDILKDQAAIKKYPELGKNGVVVMILKPDKSIWEKIKFNFNSDN